MTPPPPRRFQSLLSVFRSGGQMALQAWHSQPWCFTGLILVEILQGLVPLGVAWITKVLFDWLAQSIRSGASAVSVRELLPPMTGYVLLGLFSQMLQVANNYLNAELNRQLTLNVQLAVQSKINSLDGLAPFENPSFYNTIQLAVQGAQMGPQQTVGMLSNFSRSIITLLSFLGVLLVLDPFLAGLVALAALPQLLVQLKFGQQHFRLAIYNSPRERRASYFGYLLSGIDFAKELRLFDLSAYFQEAYRTIYKEIHHAQRTQQLSEMRWQAVLNLVSSLTGSGVFIFVLLRAFAGAISLGAVSFYTSAVSSVQNALWGIVYAFTTLNENALFYSQFQALLALPEPLTVASPPRPVPPLTTGIELRDVTFRYSDQLPWVLQGLNLTIPAGKSLALVGLNGAGKTTLVKLLTRLYDPTRGQILWDGVDIREFDPKELRRHMAAIFQDFVQYDVTAYENIALGDVTHAGDTERVRQAAIQAGVHELIQGLPQGYQTVLSRWLAEEGQGADLSGGEWQKIALARMFMRPSDLLILDEPTAALDAQAEYDVYRRFVDLISGRTCVLISHRFSTVRMAHRIAVLNEGKVIECGSHPELMSLQGTYAHLYTLQADRYR